MQFGEYCASDKSDKVKGRLKSRIKFWRDNLNAPQFVVSMIETGYRLPFLQFPPSCYLKNNLSALKHHEFVAQAITELLSNNCIIEHTTPPLCVNPLTVAAGKKLRLVIDLRHVNQYILKNKFKYEDLRSLSQIIEDSSWFFTWDLKSGYHHVDIAQEHQQYLGFSWIFDSDAIRYFTFTVLPFGLSSACFCFTKLLRPLVKRWRSMGQFSLVYLDDGIGSQPDKVSAKAASIIQRKDLKASGSVSNEEKSHWAPMQIGERLGFIINTMSMQFSLPRKRIEKIKSLLSVAISGGYCSYRYLAKIAGSVISCTLAVGQTSRLLTRQMYFYVETRSSWDSIVRFTPALLEELRFWYTNIDNLNGYRIRAFPSSCTVIFCDASQLGFGGYAATLNSSPVSGMWMDQDINKSSTYRELKAICYVCVSYVDQLKMQKVKVFTDNQAAARIVSIGSSCPELQNIAMTIFGICIKNNIELDAQWIPREYNEQADLLSRYIDKDDWAINPKVFKLLDASWGAHTFDRFASYYNSQLLRYNSRFSSPGSSGVDAFSQDWSNENNWLCPPVSLIIQTVRKLQSCNGSGTLIIPEWPSGLFWPYLHSSAMTFKPYVKASFILPKLPDLLIEGPGQRAIYKSKKSVFSGCPVFNMLALRLDFSA